MLCLDSLQRGKLIGTITMRIFIEKVQGSFITPMGNQDARPEPILQILSILSISRYMAVTPDQI